MTTFWPIITYCKTYYFIRCFDAKLARTPSEKKLQTLIWPMLFLRLFVGFSSVSICYIQCTGCLLTNIQGSRGEYGGLRGPIEESQESSQASVQIVPTYSRLQMFPLQNSFCKKAAMYCIVLTHFNIFF